MTRTRHYQWTLLLGSRPEALWPFVADTNSFNRETGLPAVRRLPVEARSDPLMQRLRLRVWGQTIEWLEEPFEWIEPYRFSVVRRYSRGPLVRMDVRLTLRPEAGGTRLQYEVDATPRGAIAALAAELQIGFISRRAFVRAFHAYDARASAHDSSGTQRVAAIPGTHRSRARPDILASARATLRREGVADRIIDGLCEAIDSGSDGALARMRPRVLAREWGTGEEETLNAMLLATRAGLLDLRWDLLCPNCRGSKSSASTLGELSTSAHCDACHIDVRANLERLVELTFRPNASARTIETSEYCIGGPRVTPHIVAQQILPATGNRELTLALAPGWYRLRTKTGLDPEPDSGVVMLRCSPQGASAASLHHSQFPADPLNIGTSVSLMLANSPDRARLFMIERLEWAPDAVTAAEVFATQTFRDLFAREALRPGEQVSAGSITLLFTDLKGSTSLYREIGDAPAFGRVMSHFDVLKAAVAANRGAIVKTMGDAIMAVFVRPLDALAAAESMHRDLRAGAAPEKSNRFAHADTKSLRLKSAIHTGACIAVTLNERLDYFGSTVNMAARLVGFSEGDDIVLSDAARADTEVASRLASMPSAPQPFELTLRGFGEARFRAWRITVGAP